MAATSIRHFNVELYEEHLEEASFLYEQHLAYLHDPELTWTDLDEFEERFEAHIDALVVGEDLALEVCKGHCVAGDFGEMHAALRVFCRRERPDLVYAVLQNVDANDQPVVQAVVDALKAECPEAWHEDLMRIMLGRCKQLVPLLAEVLGYRRAPAEDTLLRVLPETDDAGLPRVLNALGVVGGERARAVLGGYLRDENPDVACAAFVSLLRLGDEQALRHALLVAQLRPWPILALGIAGDRSAVNVLTDLARSDKVSDEILLALGMLGDLRSVATIFECLTNPERAAAAAVALQTVTGAALYEEVFVPDEIDPDELFEEEREKYEQTGEVPARPDGQPFGSNITQISINPATWRSWLAENRSHFDPALRYRHGRPLSPAALVEALRDERTPNRIRALLCEELTVRYGARTPLEIDMRVREQQQHIARLEQWVAENGAKFKPGMWYFAGQPME